MRPFLPLLSLAFALAGCMPEAPTPRPAPPAPAPTSPAAAPSTARLPTVVFLGDSLTAGLDLEAAEAFPARVGETLAAAGLPVRVVNAGVSGDTSAGGLARLDWLLAQRPEIVVVALGANDGLRGLAPERTEENLRQIVVRARSSGARVLLAGMLLPPNYGPEYTARFAGLFPRLARELEVPLVPFLLDEVAARPELNLADGIHPNADGHRRVAATVLPHLLPLVREVRRGG